MRSGLRSRGCDWRPSCLPRSPTDLQSSLTTTTRMSACSWPARWENGVRHAPRRFLARLALEIADDEYMRAAILSSFRPENAAVLRAAFFRGP